MYHVIDRGNYRQPIFAEDWARETFLICLEEACERRVGGSLYVRRKRGWALCHYFHLNPVRAKLCPVEEVLKWPQTSRAWMNDPKRRPDFYRPQIALSTQAIEGTMRTGGTNI